MKNDQPVYLQQIYIHILTGSGVTDGIPERRCTSANSVVVKACPGSGHQILTVDEAVSETAGQNKDRKLQDILKHYTASPVTPHVTSPSLAVSVEVGLVWTSAIEERIDIKVREINMLNGRCEVSSFGDLNSEETYRPFLYWMK